MADVVGDIKRGKLTDVIAVQAIPAGSRAGACAVLMKDGKVYKQWS